MSKKKAVTNSSSVKPSTSQSKLSTNQEAMHQRGTSLDEMGSSVAELVPFRERLSEKPKQLTTEPNVSDDPIPLNRRLIVLTLGATPSSHYELELLSKQIADYTSNEVLLSPGLKIANLEIDREVLIEKSIELFRRELEHRKNERYGERISTVSRSEV